MFHTEDEASVRSLAIETNGKAVVKVLQICFRELISIFSFLVLQACPRDTPNSNSFQKLLFLLCATRPLVTLVSNKNSECSLGVTTTCVVIVTIQNTVTKIPVSVLKMLRRQCYFLNLRRKATTVTLRPKQTPRVTLFLLCANDNT